MFTLLSTIVWGISVSMLIFLAFIAVDSVFRFSQPILGLLLAVWGISSLAMLFLIIRRAMRSQRSIAGAARCLEFENPELESNLINIVQLSGNNSNSDQGFVHAALEQAVKKVDNFPLEKSAQRETRLRRFIFCLQTPRDFAEACGICGMVVIAGIIGSLLMPNWGSAASRLMRPWEFVPVAGSVQITIQPGDTEILLGTSLEVSVDTIEPHSPEPLNANLFVLSEGAEKEEIFPLSLVSETTEPAAGDQNSGTEVGAASKSYMVNIPSIVKPFKYRVEVGDSQTKRYSVTLIEKPTVAEVEITYKYPPYMKLQPKTETRKTADLSAPQYTFTELSIRPTVAVSGGKLELDGGGGPIGEVRDGGNLLLAKMDMTRNANFRIILYKDDFQDPQPRSNSLKVEPDRPPAVEMFRPQGDLTLAPGQSVSISAKVSDDYGIGGAYLEYKIRDSSQNATAVEENEDSAANGRNGVLAQKLHTWEIDPAEPKLVPLEHSFNLDSQLLKPGQTLMLRVVAVDNRNYSDSRLGLDLRPQQTAGPWRSIKIIDPTLAAKETKEQLDNLRRSLSQLLDKQIRTQMEAGKIRLRETLDERAALSAVVWTQQIDIQKEAMRIVAGIQTSARQEDLLIKRDLNRVAFAEMTNAVQEADALRKVLSLEGFDEPVSKLQVTQTKIIEYIRGMLNIARKAEEKALGEMGSRSENDLPDDVRKKMEAIKNALDEAMEHQRKVIEASENLAKIPVDDYTDEDKEDLVKKLAAAEDAWDKFMTEMNTDLSKLPFQDFTNPSLLEELIEIQTEITMKKDAALEKCKDIAVPLEQLGYEMAEEITSNMEKWLPDTADREKWSQEESLSDADKEAPAAELPTELEDLIGELAEEQEDLFDEMEDISSSAMDSLDKGAGWDVADGPISNMSAKGSTGNRLPNTSEIGGRSGEGRQGKSSGEFVGDEAVGKGGRNTPSRLTPDPFVDGQIKDHSKQSAGGATGGGKKSGEGGTGLEGPQAHNRKATDNRLAGKQAELRNKAEGISLEHFKIMGYHDTDLEEMIDKMSNVERDLKAGRYAMAQRQRRVMLDGMEDIKRHIGGDIRVHDDASVNLPLNIQEDFVSGMDDPSPSGWESVNREYFRKLSEGVSGEK